MEHGVIEDNPGKNLYGSFEKSRQRRSRHFSVITYYTYAPPAKTAVPLLDGLF